MVLKCLTRLIWELTYKPKKMAVLGCIGFLNDRNHISSPTTAQKQNRTEIKFTRIYFQNVSIICWYKTKLNKFQMKND